MLKAIAGVVPLLLMGGCTSMSYQGMSADQITAAGKDKNISAICTQFTGVWGSGKNFYLNVDKSLVVNGSAGVIMNPDNCSFNMTNEATVKPTTQTQPVTPTALTVPVTVTPQVVK